MTFSQNENEDRTSMDGDGWVAEVIARPDDTPPSVQLTINNGANFFALIIRKDEIEDFIRLLQEGADCI